MNHRNKLPSLFLLLLLAVPLLMGRTEVAEAAGGVIIDEFEEIADAQILNVTLGTSPQSSTLDHASILGGERDLQTVVTANAGTMTTNTSDPGGFLNHSQPVGLRGRSILTWDGNDNDATVINHTGLGGVNLAAPTNDAFIVGVISADLVSQLQVQVFSSAANFSTATLNVPAGTSNTNFAIPFSSFVVSGGTGANFTSVGAVVLTINSAATPTAALDMVVDFFIAGESNNFMDLGDLPDSYGTLIASNGARHSTGNLFLGATIDNDTNGDPTATAGGDDTGDASDDEDGITVIGDWNNGANGGQIQAVVTGDSSACLSGWIDFNNDGDFADAGEHILDLRALPSAGSNIVAFDIPPGTFPPSSAGILTLYARFRVVKDVFGDAFCAPLSSGGDEPDLAPTGSAVNGEVEDYRFFTLDYGDLPAAYNNTQNSDNGARHQIGNLYLGANVDPEIEGKESVLTNGDDVNDGVDDEDGITFVGGDVWGDGTGTVNATVTNGPGCLIGWADYNNDGDFSDSIVDGVGTVSERIFIQFLNGGSVINFPAPRSTLGGGTFVYPAQTNLRVRLFAPNDPLFAANAVALDANGCPTMGNTTALMATITVGLALNGEVEDYQLNFSPLAVTLDKTSTREINYGWLFVTAVVGLLALTVALINPKRLFFRA